MSVGSGEIDTRYLPQAIWNRSFNENTNTIEFSGKKTGGATLSNVSGSASSVTLLAANTSRLGATIYNDSTSPLYIKFGSTASATSFVIKLLEGDYYEIPFDYTGIITGIWDTATGSARITEIT